MKTLKNILVEKLSIDSITFDKFPTSEDLEDIIEFLKKEGFKEYQISDIGLIPTFNKNKGKIFFLSDNSSNKRIWFADTSKEKISEHNPVFLLIKYSGMKIEWKCFGEDYMTLFSNKTKVIDLINKCFGWE